MEWNVERLFFIFVITSFEYSLLLLWITEYEKCVYIFFG